MATKREAEVGRDGIDNRDLRSALEYAVTIAAETAKRKPPMESPKALRAYFGADRLPTSALGRVRRVIEADDTFRERIAAGAIPALVDEVGRLWLQRPEGWRAQVDEVLAETAVEEQTEGAERALRKEEKRRLAAERATQRAVADLVAAESAAEVARAEATASAARIDELEAELARVREELTAARTEARHERDRKRATVDKLTAAQEELAALADGVLDAATRDELERLRREGAERERALSELRAAVAAAAEGADRLGDELRWLLDGADEERRLGLSGSAASGSSASLSEESAGGRSAGSASAGAAAGSTDADGRVRRPLKLPGGVRAASSEAAEFLLRSGASVYVDGYNVAMLAWPGRALCDQRETLVVSAENAARRFGASLTIVFDGADVVGGFARTRRDVRVVYSPEGVTADDVIRAEVAGVDSAVPIVVVTDDAEIVRDVKQVGGNVISSSSFAELL